VAVIRIFLDTNAYAAFKKGDADTAQVIRYADIIGVSVVVLGELLAGFTGGTKEKVNRRELDAFLDSPRVRVYPVDAETTAHYALTKNRKSPGFAGGPEKFDIYGSPSGRLRVVSRQAHDSGESRGTNPRA
jgi:predicted nucleic acid-binding protein